MGLDMGGGRRRSQGFRSRTRWTRGGAHRVRGRTVIRRVCWAPSRSAAFDHSLGLSLSSLYVTGSPSARHAWKPPTRSVARCSPSRRSDSAARLDAYPSSQITTTRRS